MSGFNPKVNQLLKIVEENCYRNSNWSMKHGDYCELVFDGIMCWPPTPVGQLAHLPCANDLIKAKQANKYATKQCTENGTWYVMKNTSLPWTNYTQCGFMYMYDPSPSVNTTNGLNENFYKDWLPLIKDISYLGYAISILFAVVALLIFITIKRLHCARNKLHIHLFFSFVLRALMFLIKDGLFVRGTVLLNDTEYIHGEPTFREEHYSWICKAIISLRNYFIHTNFMFILMEGMYLHNLMFLNLFSYKNGVVIYYVLGWGLPCLFITPWIVLRMFFEDTFCWTEQNNRYIALLIDVPIGITIGINFLLFLIIIRVLFVKINSICIQQRKTKYRKLLKSTLILIPLFGIPYSISLILSFYVEQSQILELIWLFFDQTFSAFQGLFVAIVYCLLNSDVQTEIKRKYSSLKDRNNKEFRRSRTISQTQQFSLQPMDEPQENNQKINGVKMISDSFI